MTTSRWPHKECDAENATLRAEVERLTATHAELRRAYEQERDALRVDIDLRDEANEELHEEVVSLRGEVRILRIAVAAVADDVEVNKLRAEVERLRSALRQISRWDMINTPYRRLLADAVWLKKLVDDALGSQSEGEARPAAQTVCAHCGLAEGHSRRCSVTKLGVDESRMTATPVPQGPSEAMPVALVDNLPEVPPDAVRCPESTAIGRCVLVSDHTDLHRIVVTWGRRRATPSSGDGGQDKP